MSRDPELQSPHPPRWRRLCWPVTIVLVIAAIGGAMYWRVTASQRLIREIEAAGGWHNVSQDHSGSSSFILRLLDLDRRPRRGDDVGLNGPTIDDNWIAAHNALKSLRVTGLTLHQTQVSRNGLRELLAANDLSTLIAPEIPLNDAEVELLNQQVHLFGLDLSGSQITDAGLQQLNPPRLHWLSIRDTGVTGTGLQNWLPQSSVSGLILDGRQFTPEVAQVMASVPGFRELHLYGDEVTQTHLEWLSGIPSLKQVDLYWTPITRAAAEELGAAHPQWRMRMTAPDGSLVQLQPQYPRLPPTGVTNP